MTLKIKAKHYFFKKVNKTDKFQVHRLKKNRTPNSKTQTKTTTKTK